MIKALLIKYHHGILFTGGALPSCEATLDANDDGALSLPDPIALLNYLFTDGPDLPAPFPDCGEDETPATTFNCIDFPAC